MGRGGRERQGGRLRPLGAPGAPDRRGLRTPALGFAPASASFPLVLETAAPASVLVQRGVRHSLGQPGSGAPPPLVAPAVADARAPESRPRPPSAEACSRRRLRPSSLSLPYYHAALRGPGERRREDGGRDRPGRGLYQVSGRDASCVRPEGRAGGRAPGTAWVLIADSLGSSGPSLFFTSALVNNNPYYFLHGQCEFEDRGLTPREAQEASIELPSSPPLVITPNPTNPLESSV